MITSWQLYWITRLDEIKNSLQAMSEGSWIIFFISIIAYVISFLCGQPDHYSEGANLAVLHLAHLFARTGALSFFSGFVLMLIEPMLPGEKEMAAILAIPYLTNNTQVQELPKRILALANEWLESLRPEKEKAK